MDLNVCRNSSSPSRFPSPRRYLWCSPRSRRARHALRRYRAPGDPLRRRLDNRSASMTTSASLGGTVPARSRGLKASAAPVSAARRHRRRRRSGQAAVAPPTDVPAGDDARPRAVKSFDGKRPARPSTITSGPRRLGRLVGNDSCRKRPHVPISTSCPPLHHDLSVGSIAPGDQPYIRGRSRCRTPSA